jgi:hypothetical protein
MDHNMERTSQMLALIHAIIEVADPELERFLRRCSTKLFCYFEQRLILTCMAGGFDGKFAL